MTFSAYLVAENVAQRWNLSREDQDKFAYDSQMKATKAMEEGHFVKESVSVSIPGRRGQVTVVDKDEFPKPDTTLEGLGKLRPAFAKASLILLYCDFHDLNLLS